VIEDKLVIKKLNIDDKKEIEETAELVYNWWNEEEGLPKEIVKEFIESRCSKAKIPAVFVAIMGDEVVGTVSLISNNIDFRQDLYPLITLFFVKENYRHLGIATKLMQYLINYCDNKFDSVYLTTKLDGFYEKLGFEYVETCKCYYNFKQKEIDYSRIYRKNLLKG